MINPSKKKRVDWISALPDEILCSILSFLPTKQAVATSVLSKRWKPVWRSVPSLDLEDDGKEARASLVEGVNAVILDLHHPIEKLRLRFVSHFADVRRWVNAAVQRRVQHLDLNLISTSMLLSCKTLVVLKLDNINFKPISSSSVDLPSLKVLQLRSLSFAQRGCLVNLLFGCPVLEEFTEYDLDFDLSEEEDETEGFTTVGKLLKANISSHIVEGDILMKLKLVDNVKFLHMNLIDYSFLYPLRLGAPSPNGKVYPMFQNLIHIKLQYGKYNDDWYEVAELLKYCPKLQVIVIDQPNFHVYEPELSEGELENWRYTPYFPECILLHLEECYLNDYRGTTGEFQFARLVMQNAEFLKKMTICIGDDINKQRRLELLEKLSSCTRRSATSQLYFG